MRIIGAPAPVFLIAGPHSKPASIQRSISVCRDIVCRNAIMPRAEINCPPPRLSPMPERDPDILQVLIGEMAKHRHINLVLGKALRVLGHAEFSARKVLHCAAPSAMICTTIPDRRSDVNSPLGSVRAASAYRLGDAAERTLWAAMGRRIPLSSNSPTGSTLTASSTAIKTRGLISI